MRTAHATNWTLDQDVMVLRMAGATDEAIAASVSSIGPLRTIKAVKERRNHLRNKLNGDRNYLEPSAFRARAERAYAPVGDTQAAERRDMAERSERFRRVLVKHQPTPARYALMVSLAAVRRVKSSAKRRRFIQTMAAE